MSTCMVTQDQGSTALRAADGEQSCVHSCPLGLDQVGRGAGVASLFLRACPWYGWTERLG